MDHGGLPEQRQHGGIAQMEEQHDPAGAEQRLVPEQQAQARRGGTGLLRPFGRLQAARRGIIDVLGLYPPHRQQGKQAHARHDQEHAADAVEPAYRAAQHRAGGIARVVPGLVAAQPGRQARLPHEPQAQRADERGHGRRQQALRDLARPGHQRQRGQENGHGGQHDAQHHDGQQPPLVVRGIHQRAQRRSRHHPHEPAQRHHVADGVRPPAMTLQIHSEKGAEPVPNIGQCKTQKGKRCQRALP